MLKLKNKKRNWDLEQNAITQGILTLMEKKSDKRSNRKLDGYAVKRSKNYNKNMTILTCTKYEGNNLNNKNTPTENFSQIITKQLSIWKK